MGGWWTPAIRHFLVCVSVCWSERRREGGAKEFSAVSTRPEAQKRMICSQERCQGMRGRKGHGEENHTRSNKA